MYLRILSLSLSPGNDNALITLSLCSNYFMTNTFGALFKLLSAKMYSFEHCCFIIRKDVLKCMEVM